MTAFQAALLQAASAGITGGVCLAFLAYVTGLDRAIVSILLHPILTYQIVAATILSRLPAPRVKHKPRHRMED